MLSCKICGIFQNMYFEEDLQTTASNTAVNTLQLLGTTSYNYLKSSHLSNTKQYKPELS